MINLENFSVAARGEAAETSLTSGSPIFGYTATLMPIPASPSFLCVRFAYIIPSPDYCVPPSKTLEQERKKFSFAGDYYGYPHVYPQVVDKWAQDVRIPFLQVD
jgi:hypothetical protein